MLCSWMSHILSYPKSLGKTIINATPSFTPGIPSLDQAAQYCLPTILLLQIVAFCCFDKCRSLITLAILAEIFFMHKRRESLLSGPPTIYYNVDNFLNNADNVLKGKKEENGKGSKVTYTDGNKSPEAYSYIQALGNVLTKIYDNAGDFLENVLNSKQEADEAAPSRKGSKVTYTDGNKSPRKESKLTETARKKIWSYSLTDLGPSGPPTISYNFVWDNKKSLYVRPHENKKKTIPLKDEHGSLKKRENGPDSSENSDYSIVQFYENWLVIFAIFGLISVFYDIAIRLLTPTLKGYPDPKKSPSPLPN